MSSPDSLVIVKIIGNLKIVPISEYNFMLCFNTKSFTDRNAMAVPDILKILRYKNDCFLENVGHT